MDEKTALHTAARRFCEEQHSHCATQYMELEQTANSRGSRPFSADWKYSDESYRLFPRYRLDEAILVELERLTPATLGAPRTAVVEAGQRALSRLTFEFKEKPVARLALENEFAAYRSFIESQSTSELDAVSPLPYRRVLKPEESESTWTLLKGRWGVEGRGVYWYPIGTADPPLGADKVTVGEYYLPHLAHVSMEPPVAVADVKGDKAEIWAPVQSPGGTREDVAKTLGIPEDNVTINVTLLGGGFGRKSKCDYALEAALLSKALGVPVKV